MNLADRVVARAQSQVGVRETRGCNDGIPSERYMGGRQEPWCAHLIAWLFREEGAPLPHDVVPQPTIVNPLASVSFMEETFKGKGWLVYSSPKVGDIVFFKTRGGSDVGPGRHVGLVEKITEEGRVQTIEGNLGNLVGRMVYSANNPRISSFGRVPEGYPESQTPAGPKPGVQAG